MRRIVRWVAGVAVLAGCASVGTVALADSLGADPADRYRLATASTGDVARTVSTNGTVDFVNRADVSFGVEGTLASLSVRPGQRVRAGQRLGTLDTAALRAAVDSAEADLATAKATLATDQQSQAAAAVDTDSGSEPADSGSSGQLAKQQQAVRAAQTAAGKAMAAAKAALSAQHKACAPTEAESAAPNAACTRVLAAATRAQDAVARAQDTLQKRIGELARTLSASASESASDSPSQEDFPKGEETPTAATIAEDQAAVDAAEVDLAAAKRSLAQATLTAPIAGTVASVDAAAGDSVSAGSPVVVLIGDGAAVVETSVPVERIAELEVGQRATVTPSGARDGVPGQVTRIGRLAEDSDEAEGAGDDSVTYPVTITVDEPPATMPAGSTAGVDIEVDTAEDVLTVPTSAVHGSTPATVTVLAGTQTSQREVTVGIVGPLRTEIADGRAAGGRVVLADLDAPLPSADDQTGPGGGLGGGMDGGPVVRQGPMRGGPANRAGR